MLSHKGDNESNKVQCPYNSSHIVDRHRFAQHLIKCARQYPNLKYVKCPYSNVHMIPEVELKYHEQYCEHRVSIDKFVYKPTNSVKFEIPKLNLKSEENWDDDVKVETYNPQEYCEENAILRNFKQTYSAAERRNFRMQERKRIQQLTEKPKPENKIKKVSELQELRRPTATSKSMIMDTVLQDDHNYDNLMTKINTVTAPHVNVNSAVCKQEHDEDYPSANLPNATAVWTPASLAMQGVASAFDKKRSCGRGSSLARK